MRQFTETLRTLSMSLIDIAKVLKQAATEIWSLLKHGTGRNGTEWNEDLKY